MQRYVILHENPSREKWNGTCQIEFTYALLSIELCVLDFEHRIDSKPITNECRAIKSLCGFGFLSRLRPGSAKSAGAAANTYDYIFS
jgi:hypothetical protein